MQYIPRTGRGHKSQTCQRSTAHSPHSITSTPVSAAQPTPHNTTSQHNGIVRKACARGGSRGPKEVHRCDSLVMLCIMTNPDNGAVEIPVAQRPAVHRICRTAKHFPAHAQRGHASSPATPTASAQPSHCYSTRHVSASWARPGSKGASNQGKHHQWVCASQQDVVALQHSLLVQHVLQDTPDSYNPPQPSPPQP
jgi:hypothetical protein